MIVRRTLVGLAVGSFLAVAPATAQEAAWQPPRDVSRHTAFLFGEQIVVDGQGNTVVTWAANAGKRTFSDPTFGPGAASSRVSVRPRGSEQWSRERVLPYGVTLPSFGDGRAFAADVARDNTIRVHTVTLTGRRISTQRIQTPRRVDWGPTMAVDTRGDAIVAWTARVSGALGRDQRIYAALARRGGKFGKPVALSGPKPLAAPTVAIGPRGDAAVAWRNQRTSVQAVIARNGKFGKRERVGGTENGTDISFAVGIEGAVALAWSSQPFEAEGGPTGPAKLNVAYAKPNEGFERRGMVATGMEVGSPRVAFDSNRNATVVWRDGNAIRASELRPDSLTPSTDVAPAGAEPVEIRSLSAGPDGRALVMWIAGDIGISPPPTQLRAAYRPDAAGLFGPPETVTPATEHVYRGAAVLDPRTGEATAVWERELGGANGRVLESSVRR